jgi:hypothetical protein
MQPDPDETSGQLLTSWLVLVVMALVVVVGLALLALAAGGR